MSPEPDETQVMPVIGGRTPILERLLRDVEGDLSQLVHQHGRHRPPPCAVFRRDLAELPVFAATIKARGWNGLHMHAPGGSTAAINGKPSGKAA